jgi:hypothetical protein
VKLRYEVSVDDLVAFAVHYAGQSSTLRRGRARIVWVPLAAIWGVTVTLALIDDDDPTIMLAAPVVPSLIWVLLATFLFRGAYRRGIQKVFAEGLHPCSTGPHELELSATGLVERTPFGELRTPFESVRQVTSDGERTFIYISGTAAHVVPHRSVPESELLAFVETVRERLAKQLAEFNTASDLAT